MSPIHSKNLFSKYYTNCRNIYSTTMANSKFEYVKDFENDPKLLPNSWIVIRVDGKSFHKFSDKHNFHKPNDIRALNLMNRAASKVMEYYKDVIISYGTSDEYSFVIRKNTEIYKRRTYKIMSHINSLFSSSYVHYWNRYFDGVRLKYIPCFDARVILYPTDTNLRDYLSWRQADCHVNNLYNTTFWALVLKGGLSPAEAEKRLCGTVTSDKNEILFRDYNINYNNELSIFKKGTILLRKKVKLRESKHYKQVIVPLHEDLINEAFWITHHELLNLKSPQEYFFFGEIPDLVLKQIHHNDNTQDLTEELTGEEYHN